MNATNARLDGLRLLLIGCTIFMLFGAIAGSTTPVSMLDFKSLYYGSRCLVSGCDPFEQSDVLRLYRSEGGENASDTPKSVRITTEYGNLPTTVVFVVPFAMLPWGPAHAVWMAFIGASFVLAALLMWNLGAEYAPLMSGGMIFVLLAGSEILLLTGNAAGIVVSFTIVAAWCFLQNRFVWAGVLCLAVGLAIKPHDSGLVWLYFLLAGGVYRRRALQSLLAAVAIGLPAVLFVWRIAPHWMQELNANLNSFSSSGDVADPHLASLGIHDLGMLINLQTVLSFFWNHPIFYNTVSYLVGGALILVWMLVVLRSRPSMANSLLALAAIAPLSMLPIYHRAYDAKLLLIAVPACAMLWIKGGLIGRLAFASTTAGFVFTGDLMPAVLLGIASKLHASTAGGAGQIMTALQVVAAPLSLLAMGVFYLCVYARQARTSIASAGVSL